MANFWDNKDDVSEWQTLSETIDESTQEIVDDFESDEEDETIEDDEIIEEGEEFMDNYKPNGQSAYKLDKRESNVLLDATIRLEQARLYDMLIKHDLFAGVQAHPRALANVQRELKEYIVSRLEILLGIKEEKKPETEVKEIVVESPFNDIEIEFLKVLSYKGTNGASANASTKMLKTNEIKNIAPQEIKENTLKPISMHTQQETIKPIKHEQTATAKKTVKHKKIHKKPIKPTKSVTPSTNTGIQSIKRKSKTAVMTDAEATAIAMEDLKKNGPGLSKHPYEMTPQELQQLIKKQSKPKVVRPPNALMPATAAQVEQLIYQQQMDPSMSHANAFIQKIIHDKINK